MQVTVYTDRFELHARGWGWRIGFDSVVQVGETQPAPDGDGVMVPIVWRAPDGERTLLLSGRDAGRLRFLLAQSVAVARLADELPQPHSDAPPPPAGGRRRYLGPWQRELRRMRAVTAAALVVALVALVTVFGIALLVVARDAGGSRWAQDRAVLEERAADVRIAEERNDAGALSQALQALVEECHRLEARNSETANTGDDFTAAQRTCSTVGVVLH